MNCCSNLWNVITRKKRYELSEKTPLARVLNLFDLTALGVGSTLGLGVYVLAGSVAVEQAGPAVVLSFLLAGIASAFAAFCYAEFAARVPRAGSAYVYSYVTIGELVAFTIGWNLILEYVIGASSVTRGLSGYVDSLFDNKMKKFWMEIVPMNIDFLAEYPDILSFTIITVLTIILAYGVKESSIVHNFCTVVNILTILIVVIAGSIKADPKNWAIAKEDIEEGRSAGEGGFMPYGIAGVMAGAAKCFYGFVGFDCVATAGEEAKNPKRNVPLSVIFTLLICITAYVSLSTVLTMMWPYYDLNPEAPLPHVFQQIGWDVIRWIVSVVATFALLSALLGALYPLPRICYAMGQDGVLFKFLGSVNPKTKTPLNATLVSGLFAAIMAAVFSLHQLVDMMSIGTLMAYTIVAVCVLVLRYENVDSTSDDRKKNWKQVLGFSTADKPTAASSNLTKTLIVVFIVLAIILGCLLTFVEFTVINISSITIVSVMMILIVCWIFLQPIDKSTNISFKVPLVPLLPCVSIFCNIYLMLQLDAGTWIRFGVWLLIGYFIYFIYGIRKAAENVKRMLE